MCFDLTEHILHVFIEGLLGSATGLQLHKGTSQASA
jgi:hypothetical protein